MSELKEIEDIVGMKNLKEAESEGGSEEDDIVIETEDNNPFEGLRESDVFKPT